MRDQRRGRRTASATRCTSSRASTRRSCWPPCRTMPLSSAVTPNGCSTSSRPPSRTSSCATFGRGRSVSRSRRTTSAEPCAGRSTTRRPTSASSIGGACWRFWFHWAELARRRHLAGGAPRPARSRHRGRAAGPRPVLARRAVVAPGPPSRSLDAYLEVVDILRSLGIDDERFGDALDDAAWGAAQAMTRATVRLTEEKWRYPRRPRSHRFDGWLSREMDLRSASGRLARRGCQPGVIAALEAILEDVDRSDQALSRRTLALTVAGHQHAVGDRRPRPPTWARRAGDATATSDIADRCRSACWGSPAWS